MKKSKITKKTGYVYYQTIRRAPVLGEKDLPGTPVRVAPYGQRTVTTEELAASIQQASSLTEADVAGVLTALGHEVATALLSGNRVTLDGLGTFSISLSIDREAFAGRVKPQKLEGDDLKANEIRINKVLFTPDGRLKERLRGAKFVSSGVHSSGDLNPKLVEGFLRRSFSDKGYICRRDLESTFDISTRRANQLLRELVDDGRVRPCGTQSSRFYLPGTGEPTQNSPESDS